MKDFPKDKYIDVSCRVCVCVIVFINRLVVLLTMLVEFLIKMDLRFVMFLVVGILGDSYLIRSKSLFCVCLF